MKLYLDCRHGVSGDMTLAALAHLDIDLAPLQGIINQAGIDCRINVFAETRDSGPGMRVDVDWPDGQPLRHPADIEAIFRRCAVSETVLGRALKILNSLTEAEAYAHQIPVEEVHFHEVGAVDTLVDVLGAAWAVERLGVKEIMCSPLPWFSGTVECAHGTLALPAPATARLMRDKPVFASAATSELITPTGAAIIHALADRFATGPEGVLRGMGTGYGSRPAANGLRVLLCASEAGDTPYTAEHVGMLETHIDHLTGEELGLALEAMAESPEIIDVLWLPGTGKKNRPAGLLRVMCRPGQVNAAAALVFRHTHTLGLRHALESRYILPRCPGEVETALGALKAKRHEIEGRFYTRPEADAVKEAVREAGVGAPAVRFDK